jgi:hypothetical protein
MNISAIFSIVSLLLMFFIMYRIWRLNKTKKSIGWDVRQGIRCYCCKIDLIENSELNPIEKTLKMRDIYERLSKNKKSEEFNLCTTCNRDCKLIDITTHNFIKKIFNKNSILNINKYLYSNKSDKLTFILLGCMLLFHLVDFLVISNSNYKTYFGSSFTIIYWLIFYYRTELTYKKTL